MSLRPAATVAGGFPGIYALSGLFLIPVAVTFSGEGWGLEGILVGIHLVSAVVLWPSTTVAALLLDKWRGPPRRLGLCIGGVLSVPVVWFGGLIGAGFSERMVPMLHSALGGAAGLVVYFSWAVLFMNLTLLLAWGFRGRTRPS